MTRDEAIEILEEIARNRSLTSSPTSTRCRWSTDPTRAPGVAQSIPAAVSRVAAFRPKRLSRISPRGCS